MQIPIADALDDLLRFGAAMLRVPAPPQKQASEGNKDQVIPGAPMTRCNWESVIERGCEHPRAQQAAACGGHPARLLGEHRRRRPLLSSSSRS